MYNLMDVVMEHVTEHGKISLEEFYALEAKSDKRPTLKASRDLKLSIENMQKCMEKLKSLPLIKDTKADVSKLSSYQERMRALMKTFMNNAKRAYSFYYKDLQYDSVDMTTESAVDDYNDKVKQIIDETEEDIAKISKQAKSKREKEEAVIKIANKRLEAVQDAFKAVEIAYDDFITAVKNAKPDIDDEFKLLKVQCKIFINQYQLLTGYVKSSIRNIIKTMGLAAFGIGGIAATNIYGGVDDSPGPYFKLSRGSTKTLKRNIEKLRNSVKSKD